MKRLLQVLVIVFGLVILGAGLASLYISFRLSALKAQLAESLSHELKAQVSIGSISLDPWQCLFIAHDVTLINSDSKKTWKKASVEEAEATFNYTDFVHEKLPLEIHLNHWNLSVKFYDGKASEVPADEPVAVSESVPQASPTEPPPGIQINSIAANTGHIEFIFSTTDSAECDGVNLRLTQNSDRAWLGTVNADSFKILSPTESPFAAYDVAAKLRLETDHIELKRIDCQCRPGEITGNLSAWLGERPGLEEDLTFQQLPLAPILPQAWEGKVSGLASGQVHFSNRGGQTTAQGHIKVDQCLFNLFPVITTVTRWLQTSDYGSLTLDHAETGFSYESGAISLSDLDLRKEGIVSVVGNVGVDDQDNLTGHVQFGVPTFLTSKWPNLQDEIFMVDRDDSHWADVHLSGTLSQPKEDLSPRLAKLASEQGKGLINTTTTKALDWLGNLMGK